MPYLEILAPRATADAKRELARVATDAVVNGFDVAPSTVTIYFVPIGFDDYAHAGEYGLPMAGGRVFVKVHAYRRDLARRRAVAAALTPALAACFGTHDVAVYFLDRERDEVAHDGHLASDETTPTASAPATATAP
jgi:phenylpyruvate tautomerase PptA (4-oxalocrotonate tautomerase family)